MKFYRCRNVKLPVRAHNFDAGIDFFIPEDTKEFRYDLLNKTQNIENEIDITKNEIIIPPHKRILIPAGVKTLGREGYALIAFNKSGVASKLGLDIGASVVDELYRGEIHINLTNTTDKHIILNFGQKIVQFILIPVFYDLIKEMSSEEFSKFENTERGSGGFGSTGNS